MRAAQRAPILHDVMMLLNHGPILFKQARPLSQPLLGLVAKTAQPFPPASGCSVKRTQSLSIK
jgi:hypothetical protein